MSYDQQVRTPGRGVRTALAVVLALAVAAILGAVLGYQVVTPFSSTGSTVGDGPLGTGSAPAFPGGATADDGVIAGGFTVLDDDVPAVVNLDPDLRDALDRAARAAADDGVTFLLTSGWRSPAYQDQLLREAVAEYGSAEEAARWVATAETSAHVTGDAVDIGRSDATDWLARHGAGFGLCRVYGNEPWHLELRPGAIGDGCPRPYADPTQDPRMHR